MVVVVVGGTMIEMETNPRRVVVATSHKRRLDDVQQQDQQQEGVETEEEDPDNNDNDDNNNDNDQYCTFPMNLIDPYQASQTYTNTRAVSWMHSVPPRYGKSNNIDLLLRSSSSTTTTTTAAATTQEDGTADPTTPTPSTVVNATTTTTRSSSSSTLSSSSGGEGTSLRNTETNWTEIVDAINNNVSNSTSTNSTDTSNNNSTVSPTTEMPTVSPTMLPTVMPTTVVPTMSPTIVPTTIVPTTEMPSNFVESSSSSSSSPSSSSWLFSSSSPSYMPSSSMPTTLSPSTIMPTTSQPQPDFIASAISSVTDGNVQVTQTESDYIRGLLASSITMFVFFLLWSIILLIFKFVSIPNKKKKEKKKKKGSKSSDHNYDDNHNDEDHHEDYVSYNNPWWRWLAGRPFQVPPEPPETTNYDERQHQHWQQHDQQQYQQYQQHQQQQQQQHDESNSYDSYDDSVWENWYSNYQHVRTRLYICRFIVIGACLSIIVSAIVMSWEGTAALKRSLDDARTTISLVDGLAYDATTILDDVIQQNANVASELVQLLQAANYLCPTVAPNGICPVDENDNNNNVTTTTTTDLSLLQACDFTNFAIVAGIEDADTFNGYIQSVLGHFAMGNRSVIYQEIINARTGLSMARQYAREADNTAQQFDWALWLATCFSLLLSVLVLFLMVGLIIRSCHEDDDDCDDGGKDESGNNDGSNNNNNNDRQNDLVTNRRCCTSSQFLACVQSKFVMPLLVILVSCSYIFSLVFVTASIATADMCIYESADSNVDVRVLTVLERFEQSLSPVVVEFASFYINQCPQTAIPQEIVDQLDYVLAGVPLIQQFSAIVEETTDLIDGFCLNSTDDSIGNDTTVDELTNGNDFLNDLTVDTVQTGSRAQEIVRLAERVEVQLCDIAEILKDVRRFFQCERWFPLYETAMYEAVCTDAPTGFAYVASTQFVIVFMAFIILTFRVAFYDIQIGDKDTSEEKNDDKCPDKNDPKSFTANDQVVSVRTSTDEVSEVDAPSTPESFRYYSSLNDKLRQRVQASRKRQHDLDSSPSRLDLEGPSINGLGLVGLNMTSTTTEEDDDEEEGDYDDYAKNTYEDDVDFEEGEIAHRLEDVILDDTPLEAASNLASCEECSEAGIEVEHYTKRKDAWGIWAMNVWGDGD